ncbi:unnamed protein product [Trichogramma brassicae]|uniref:Uncharacterized protein n=1 Tax=Trichogramma brassicae TaxID=86971 RepID=A0A6H5IJR9_9HYME|nr:unnamed protein product [Trichogramma brassicae]
MDVYELIIGGARFIGFVNDTGYKDEHRIDRDGKPLLRRTTPVHQAARCSVTCVGGLIREICQIYDEFDVNYVDETGLTHFHVACMSGCQEVVEKFLEHGQDPNLIWQKTNDSPLHLALKHVECREVIELLLRGGADPNSVDAEGFTALHLISKRNKDDDLVKVFFDVNEEMDNLVEIDAVDNQGRTPLYLAVANLVPRVVDAILDRGADLSSLVSLAGINFGRGLRPWYYEKRENFKMRIAAGSLGVVERLEKRGYELVRDDALTIMKLFAEHELFEKSVDIVRLLRRNSRENEQDKWFLINAKKITVNASLSLYDAIQLRPEEAKKQLAYTDYFEFARSDKLRGLFELHEEACVLHLCEKLSRGFFRRWAMEFLMELTRYRLPILCCGMILEKLTNEDLWHICLATQEQRS